MRERNCCVTGKEKAKWERTVSAVLNFRESRALFCRLVDRRGFSTRPRVCECTHYRHACAFTRWRNAVNTSCQGTVEIHALRVTSPRAAAIKQLADYRMGLRIKISGCQSPLPRSPTSRRPLLRAVPRCHMANCLMNSSLAQN